MGRAVGKRARLGLITGAATVLAVLLVVVSALLLGSGGAARGATPGQTDVAEPSLARGAGDSWYYFNATGLPANGTLRIAFGDYPGKSFGPANVTLKDFGTPPAGGSPDYPGGVLLNVSWNVTFSVTFPGVIDGAQSCSDLGQVCSTPTYTFVSATNATAATTQSVIAFVAGKSPHAGSNVAYPTGSYVAYLAYNTSTAWTAEYSSGSTNGDTGLGLFGQDAYADLSAVFVTYAVLWLVFAVILIVAAVAYAHGRKGQRRRG